jgi:hypothetical protein
VAKVHGIKTPAHKTNLHAAKQSVLTPPRKAAFASPQNQHQAQPRKRIVRQNKRSQRTRSQAMCNKPPTLKTAGGRKEAQTAQKTELFHLGFPFATPALFCG